MTDLYATLGVPRTAAADEIKKAYRKLASQHHPDKGGDTAKFQQIQTAYDTLSDPAKRQQYDSPQPQWGNFAQNTGGQQFDFNTIFNVFGAQFNQQRRQQTPISKINVSINLVDVITGGKRTIGLGHGQGNAIEIEIPQGINNGDGIQYRGLAPGGGDLIVTFRVAQHPDWQRDGSNLFTDHNIEVWDLILGGESTVKDILGNNITIMIPPGTQPGARMRLRGHGIPGKNGPGDIIVTIQAVIPKHIPEDLLNMIKQERANHS